MHRPDKTLDIQGIAGRRASALARQTLELMRPGQILKLITTEKDAGAGIAALCREEGYALLQDAMEGSHLLFLIKR